MTDENLRSLTPQQRKCLFPDEAEQMKLHKHYSQGNCLLECSLEFAQNMQYNNANVSPCTPWFFPFIDQGHRMCDPWEAEQLSHTIANKVNIPLQQIDNFQRVD